jgi:hypothetical protein
MRFMNRFLLTGVACLAAACGPAASAATIYVNVCGSDSASGELPLCDPLFGAKATIQAAINAASDGDEIVVQPGSYGPIDFFAKAITVRAQPLGSATIQGPGTPVKVRFGEGPDSVLDGFTITGGTGSNSGGEIVAGGVLVINSSPTIRNCVIENNTAGYGGGMLVRNGSPTVSDCQFLNNVADNAGGGVRTDGNSNPLFRDCLFESNNANYAAGMDTVDTPATVIGCSFRFNSANVDGGAMYNNHTNIVIANCEFYGNTAVGGAGGIMNYSELPHTPLITNCTIVGNTGPIGADGMYSFGWVNADVSNCIFFNNGGPGGTNLAYNGLATTTVSYTNVAGWTGGGVGNINVPPSFVSSSNLRLTAGSACRDAGSNALADACEADLDGNERIHLGTVDMGAYEYASPPAADDDGDGVLNACDVCTGDDATGDSDGDGVCDDLDFCTGDDATGDSDGDGVCDDLDLCSGDDATGDSDGDGVCDDIDVCSGDDATGDSDGDGVCDDIDACPGFDDALDDDGDGVADGCDACPGFDDALDGDGDGVADGCDACPGTAPGLPVDASGCAAIRNISTGVGYPTIQAAVNAAANGQTIELADGTYTGAGNRGVTIGAGREITMRSASGDPGSCIIDAEDQDFGLRIELEDDVVIEGLTIRNGRDVNGGGMQLQSSDATIRNCVFDANTAETINGRGGGLYCSASSPLVVGCLFSGNHSEASGGALAALGIGPGARLVDCTFSVNSAMSQGGVLYAYSSGAAEFVNCTMLGSSAGLGAAIRVCCGGEARLIHCTIHGSTGGATVDVGAGVPADSTATIDNSIVWGNAGAAINLRDEGTATVNSSNVEGGWAGSGNIDADPQFADADKRLGPGSPCIDAADETLLPADVADLDGDGNTSEPLPLDLDGTPRVQDGDDDGDAAPDMGAYEFPEPPCPEDLNGNGNVDFADILAIIAAWGPCVGECPEDLNGNGQVDFADILAVIGAWGSCPS